jgi:ribosomal protein S18 acetylase RimI-like enzyme
MTTPTTLPALRRGGPGDAAALSAFAARVFVETFGPHNRAEDIAQYVTTTYGPTRQAAELADPAIVTIVAEDQGDLAGFAQVRHHPPPASVPGPAPVELWRFYVGTAWRGQGLAQRLMDAVHAAATEMGGRTLWLAVWERNPRAIAFYEKVGFRRAGTQVFMLGADRQTDNIMVAPVR